MDKQKNKKKVPIKSGTVPAEKKCSWVVDIPDNELNNRDTKKILNFYVFHTPIEKTCEIARPLSLYNWKDPWHSPESLKEKMIEATTSDDFMVVSDYVEDMQEKLSSAGLLSNFPMISGEEKICIYNSDKNQGISLLHHIRNCFAHGRFRIYRGGKGVDVFYAFEDITTDKNVSARMIIKQRTLLKWIEIIEAGPERLA